MFEGVVGSGPYADIAIDDIQMSSGACATPGDCTFEKDTCIWSNTQNGDDFDWLRKKGRTNSQFTGPSTDHTTGDVTGTLYHLIFAYSQLNCVTTCTSYIYKFTIFETIIYCQLKWGNTRTS